MIGVSTPFRCIIIKRMNSILAAIIARIRVKICPKLIEFVNPAKFSAITSKNPVSDANDSITTIIDSKRVSNSSDFRYNLANVM